LTQGAATLSASSAKLGHRSTSASLSQSVFTLAAANAKLGHKRVSGSVTQGAATLSGTGSITQAGHESGVGQASFKQSAFMLTNVVGKRGEVNLGSPISLAQGGFGLSGTGRVTPFGIEIGTGTLPQGVFRIISGAGVLGHRTRASSNLLQGVARLSGLGVVSRPGLIAGIGDLRQGAAALSGSGIVSFVPVIGSGSLSQGNWVITGVGTVVSGVPQFVAGNRRVFTLDTKSCAPAFLEKRTGESWLYDLNCGGMLFPGAVILETPVFSCDQEGSALTFGSVSINDADVEYRDGSIGPAHQVIQVRIGGGAIPAGRDDMGYEVPNMLCSVRARFDAGQDEADAVVQILLIDRIPR